MKTISDNTEISPAKPEDADAFVITIQLQWTCLIDRGRMASDPKFAAAAQTAYEKTMAELTQIAPAMFEYELMKAMGVAAS
jgi:hypothetical protein